jgi:hypothetical protein
MNKPQKWMPRDCDNRSTETPMGPSRVLRRLDRHCQRPRKDKHRWPKPLPKHMHQPEFSSNASNTTRHSHSVYYYDRISTTDCDASRSITFESSASDHSMIDDFLTHWKAILLARCLTRLGYTVSSSSHFGRTRFRILIDDCYGQIDDVRQKIGLSVCWTCCGQSIADIGLDACQIRKS